MNSCDLTSVKTEIFTLFQIYILVHLLEITLNECFSEKKSQTLK